MVNCGSAYNKKELFSCQTKLHLLRMLGSLSTLELKVYTTDYSDSLLLYTYTEVMYTAMMALLHYVKSSKCMSSRIWAYWYTYPH